MFNLIAQRIKKNLMQEIQNLSAADLEDIGHYMISHIEGKELIHHGININRRPVGYTVDSFSEDEVIVGEYSVEESYFQDYSDKNGYYKKFIKISNTLLITATENFPEYI